MESPRVIKKRIESVESTMKISSALKTISASKLRHVQESVGKAREFSILTKELALQVARKAGETSHPAFVVRKKPKKVVVIVITTDRGLCGALNNHIVGEIKPFLDLMKERGSETSVWLLGSKGARYFDRFGIKYRYLDVKIEDEPDDQEILDFCERMLGFFMEEKIDQVVLAYNQFISLMKQQVVLEMFLPVWNHKLPEFDNSIDYIYEPTKEHVIDTVLMESLKSVIHQGLLEARVSELAARMISMDQAFKNAREMKLALKKEFNKIRQTSITKDLLDIISGAEALKGGELL